MTYPILPGGSPIPAAPRGPLAAGVLMSRRCACGVVHILSTENARSVWARVDTSVQLVDKPLALMEGAPDTQWCQANRIAGAHP